MRIKVLECSAKDGHNVNELFKTMLSLSRFSQVGNADSSTGLKRRSSAYVSATSKGMLFLKKIYKSDKIFYFICGSLGK